MNNMHIVHKQDMVMTAGWLGDLHLAAPNSRRGHLLAWAKPQSKCCLLPYICRFLPYSGFEYKNLSVCG